MVDSSSPTGALAFSSLSVHSAAIGKLVETLRREDGKERTWLPYPIVVVVYFI